MGDPDPAAAAAAAVQAVSLKLPTFLASRPDVWFQQTEAQFALRHITDSTTQYYYLLTALDPVVAERMAGDVALTPGDDKYAYLKQKLMEVYGLTDDQKADRLLDLSGIGDWKPSQLCAHIQSLTVGNDVININNCLKVQSSIVKPPQYCPSVLRKLRAKTQEDNSPQLIKTFTLQFSPAQDIALLITSVNTQLAVITFVFRQFQK